MPLKVAQQLAVLVVAEQEALEPIQQVIQQLNPEQIPARLLTREMLEEIQQVVLVAIDAAAVVVAPPKPEETQYLMAQQAMEGQVVICRLILEPAWGTTAGLLAVVRGQVIVEQQQDEQDSPAKEAVALVSLQGMPALTQKTPK